MIKIKANVKDGVSPAIARLIDNLEDTTDLNEVGGRGASEAAKEWHAEFASKGGWRGDNYIDGPGRRSGEFAQNVSLGWNVYEADSDGVTISNNADFFAFKVRGGLIIPKRTSHLTIPMVSETVGRRVADYEAISGNSLFRIFGKKALFEALPSGGVRAVYALAEESRQEPMPQAVPDSELLASAFIEAWKNALADKLEDA